MLSEIILAWNHANGFWFLFENGLRQM